MSRLPSRRRWLVGTTGDVGALTSCPQGATRHRGEDSVNALGLRNDARVGFLKVAAADFMAGDLRRDSEDRHTAAVTVVEAVDQMRISGTATAGAHRQGVPSEPPALPRRRAVSSCRTEIQWIFPGTGRIGDAVGSPRHAIVVEPLNELSV